MNVTPVTGPPEKLLIVTVNWVHCPGATFETVTAFETVSWAFAVSVAVTGPGLAKFFGFTTAFAGTVFTWAPSTVDVMEIVSVQFPPGPAFAPVERDRLVEEVRRGRERPVHRARPGADDRRVRRAPERSWRP